MEELLIWLVPILASAVGIGIAARRRSAMSMWKGLLRSLSLSDAPTLVIQKRGVVISLERPEGKKGIRCVVDGTARWRWSLSAAAKEVNMQGVLTQDASFDAAVQVLGPADEVAALLGHDLRSQLQQWVEAGWVFQKGQVFCEQLDPEVCGAGGAFLRELVDFAETLSIEEELIPELLWRNVREDPLVAVQRYCYGLLVQQYADSSQSLAAVQWGWASEDDEIYLITLQHEDQEGAEKLIAFIEDDDVSPELRVRALRWLAENGDEERWIPLCKDLLLSSHKALVKAAVNRLGALKRKDFVYIFGHVAHNASPEVALCAVKALGRSGHVSAEAILAKLQAHSAGAVRKAAKATLAYLQISLRRSEWRKVAESLGLHMGSAGAEGAPLIMQGVLEGFPIAVQGRWSSWKGAEYHTVLEMDVSNKVSSEQSFSSSFSGGFQGSMRGMGRGEVFTGDRDFDQEVLLRGDGALWSALLCLDFRLKLREGVKQRALHLSQGRLRSMLEGVTPYSTTLTENIVFMADVAGRLVLRGAMEKRLQDNLRLDPNTGIRRQSLQLLWRKFSETEVAVLATQGALGDPDISIALMAAKRLGSHGAEALAEIVQRQGGHWAARKEALLALRSLKKPTLLLRALDGLFTGEFSQERFALDKAPKLGAVEEKLLLAALDCFRTFAETRHEDRILPFLRDYSDSVSISAARILEKIGTLRSVEVLVAASKGAWSSAELKSAMRSAVQAIQERSGGGDRGGLSLLVEGPAQGALAVVDEAQGALTVSKTDSHSSE